MWEILWTYLRVFMVGGAICTIGQLLINYTKLTSGRILVIFLLSGVVLRAVGVFPYIVKFGEAGATVPICGFGHLLAEGAIRGARQDGLWGAITGGLTAAAAGVTAAILFGFLMAVLFRAKSKKN